ARRRTPGLRREEVAQSCGMSATWYTWLEQGRDVSASPTALAGLAGALRLTPAERAYLFALAGKRDPSAPPAPDDAAMDVPPALAALIDDLRRRSALFARAWSEHAVVDRTGGARRFAHPRAGRLSYEQIAFTMASRPDFTLVMLVPQDAPIAARPRRKRARR